MTNFEYRTIMYVGLIKAQDMPKTLVCKEIKVVAYKH